MTCVRFENNPKSKVKHGDSTTKQLVTAAMSSL